MALPDLPPRIQEISDLHEFERVFYAWFQEQLKNFINTNMHTIMDFTVLTKGKGVVLTNAAGTITRRVRLNDTGDGLIFESL